jgi:hypothetical protein
MEKNNVEVYTNTDFDESFLATHNYDHVILCKGASYNPSFMKNSSELSDCVNARGRIFVNDYLQITNINPLTKTLTTTSAAVSLTEELDGDHEPLVREEKRFKNIFCFGDICQTSINEEKTVFPLK